MGEITLKEALQEYISVYMAYRNFAERTREEYKNDLNGLVEYLEKSGIMKVGELRLSQIERYLAHLENKGYAGATRKRKTVAIRSFLSFLFKDGYISSNIAKHLIPPFIDSKTPKYLTENEYNRLRKACAGNVRDAAMIELLLQTGIRLSELTHLTLDDIEFSEGGGLIRIKASRRREERMLPLNSKACNVLKAYITCRPDTSGLTFFLNRFGESLGDRGVQKILNKYLKNANIKKVSVHSLRHTFGVHHTAKGTNIYTVQMIMGLKVRSTSIYQSLAKRMVDKKFTANSL
jgi:site-specific recombinase XerD